MRSTCRSTAVPLLILLGSCALCSTRAAAQTPPPIHGVTGTVATEGTIQDEHAAAPVIAGAASRAVHRAKSLFSFGSKGSNENPLDAFTEGRQVVVRDAADGDDGSKASSEGVVIDVNRGRRQITVRFADRKTQTLRLNQPAAAGADPAARVVVSYKAPAGTTVACDFIRVS
jgi:hypothetical protein